MVTGPGEPASTSAAGLHAELAEPRGDGPLILDVRNREAFEAWHIDAAGAVRLVNIPYFEFVEDTEGCLARLPAGRPITAVCATGESSGWVASRLVERGVAARNLEGGMQAWGNLLVPCEVRRWPGDGALVQLKRVGKGCLSYLLVSRGEALVVDPSRAVDTYLHVASARGARITRVVDTHLHADHVSGGRALAAATGAVYHLSAADADGAPFTAAWLRDGDALDVGGTRVRVVALSTPGHTPGSTCLVVNDEALLSGDTLFVSSVGRPDLGGQAAAWAEDLYVSLRRLRAFPDELLVLPAHYSGVGEVRPDGLVVTTLGELRRANAAFEAPTREAFRAYVLAHLPGEAPAYGEIRRINLGRSAPGDERIMELEVGQNRCALAGGPTAAPALRREETQ